MDSASDRNLLQCAVAAVVSALLVCRLLTPTEAAMYGETLWIAQMWLVALLLWGVASWRECPRLRFDGLDAVVWLLVGGQVVAALVVVATSGDKRSAINMIWEWIALGLTFFLVRQTVRTGAECRTLMLVLLATAVSLSGLGLSQHFGGAADVIREVEALQSRWERLQREGRPEDPVRAAEWDAEARRLEWEWMDLGIPANPGERILWEKRLTKSREPFAMFALTNTLAGLLMTSLVLLLAGLFEAVRRREPWRRVAAGMVACGVVGYCLLLTKSRTAYVGLLVGMGVWLLCLIRAEIAQKPGFSETPGFFNEPARLRRLLAWLGGGAAATVALIGVALWTGGLDRLVFLQSSKSLKYRLEYWSTTWEMLCASPRNFLIGVGPGNFRQNYLQFKLPESSEEILDPHNLLLDVWANGGILGLAGLLGICGGAVWLVWRGWTGKTDNEATSLQRPPAELRNKDAPTREKPQKSGFCEQPGFSGPAITVDPLLVGGACGFILVFLVGAGVDLRLLQLLIGWLVAVALCRKLFRTGGLPTAAIGAACAALLVHLLGAGGIAMPAICQTLLVLLAVGTAGCVQEEDRREHRSAWIGGAAISLGLLAGLGCWFTATAPVWSRIAHLNAGDYAALARGDLVHGEAEYHRATVADPFDPEPFGRLAQLGMRQWSSAAGPDAEDAAFEKLVAWQREAIRRNPRMHSAHVDLGEHYLTRFARTRNTKDADAAADAFDQAVALYPNSPRLLSLLAEALGRAGRGAEARRTAERALHLHEINQEAGHVDKMLPEERLALLRSLIAN